MSRGKAESFSHARAHVWLGRAAVALAVLLVPHAVAAALLIAHERRLTLHWDAAMRASFDAGRIDTLTETLIEFEQRIDQN